MILIIFISLLLDFIFKYYYISYSLLFISSVISFIIINLNNKRVITKLFITIVLYDLFFEKLFLLNSLIIILIYLIIKCIYKRINKSLFSYISVFIISLINYFIIKYLIILIIKTHLFPLSILFNIILHSLLINIIFSSILYLIFGIKHKKS